VSDPLDNPLWASLSTLHAPFARRAGELARYPREVAPFIAVPDVGVTVTAAQLDELIEPGDEALFVGPVPAIPAGWTLVDLGAIVQMVCASPVAVPAGEPPPMTWLGEADRPAILALTRLVYPHYFRPRTPALGRYRGIVTDGQLDAMVGERMGFPGHRELSAVCTHPDCTGRGLSRWLLVVSANELLAEGTTPFLHVAPDNARALSLYERNGFARRRDIALTALRRA